MMHITDITAVLTATEDTEKIAAAWRAQAAREGFDVHMIEADTQGRPRFTESEGRVYTIVHGRGSAPGETAVRACRAPTEIASTAADDPLHYPLLAELGECMGSRRQTHEAIHTHLAHIIDIRGGQVILARRPIADASGQVTGEWLTIDADTEDLLHRSVQAEAEQTRQRGSGAEAGRPCGPEEDQ